MAKITIAGGCFVVTSKVSMADLELIRKHRPKALKIVEETKEELFVVGIGGNSLSDYGISFGGVSNDEQKLAAVTLPIPSDVEDAQEYVAEKAGAAVVNNFLIAKVRKVQNEALTVLQFQSTFVNHALTLWS